MDQKPAEVVPKNGLNVTVTHFNGWDITKQPPPEYYHFNPKEGESLNFDKYKFEVLKVGDRVIQLSLPPGVSKLNKIGENFVKTLPKYIEVYANGGEIRTVTDTIDISTGFHFLYVQ